MKPVRFHPEASAELEEAIHFYEDRCVGLGRALLDEVEQTTNRLRDHPLVGAAYKETEVRHYGLRRFPYILFYLELVETIWIVAVAHAKRRPGYWRNRSVDPADERQALEDSP